MLCAFAQFALLFACTQRVDAVLTYSVEAAAGWPSQGHYDAAVAAIASSVARYNDYGDFNNTNNHVYVYYDAGIPTAQANWGGSIGFGGTYPAERVMMHEMAHFLGLPDFNQWNGTGGGMMSGGVWQGPRASQLVRQFDGDQATLSGDSIHFWPYGLNFDSEGSEINRQRQVAVVYAMRADLGIGPTAHPSGATSVSLTGSDAFGTTAFYDKARWSDGYYAHAGADYSVGPYEMRTPQSTNSYTFAGDSLLLDNTNISSGLVFKGVGTGGVVTINNLILNGGWVHHGGSGGATDLFQLDGAVNIVSDSNLRALNGNMHVLADINGAGALTLHETNNPAEDNRYVRFMSPTNGFTGDLINNARFELTEGANFKFEVGAAGVSNSISGAAARNTLINGIFELDLTGASSNPGDSWSLVTAANTSYGPTFDIPGFSHSAGSWSNGLYTFNQSTGMLSLVTSWSVDGGGVWNNGAHWSGGVPVAGGDATLGAVLTAPNAPATVELDTPVTLNRLTIDNANTYVLAGTNTMTLVGAADLLTRSGSHEIAVPVVGAAGLVKSGSGSLTLSAVNPYSGDTTIAEGTLKLAGTATIANSANVHVQSDATLDVSATAAMHQLQSGQTLRNDAVVVGDLITNGGAVVTGAGVFQGHLTLLPGATLRVGGAGLTVVSSPQLVDNFDSYNNTLNQNIGAHGNGDVTTGVWDGVFDGTNNGQIVDNANPADNALVAFGIPGQGAGGWRGGVTDLQNSFDADHSLDDGDSATYFFRVLNEGNAFTDTMIGLTESTSTLDINNAWQDFSVMPFVVGSPGSATLNVAGTQVAPMVDGQWRNVWLVVDNATKTFDLYTSIGDDDGSLAMAGIGFGYLPNPSDLDAFGIANRENGRVRIDDLFRTAGVNTLNPLADGGGVEYAPDTITVEGDLVLAEGAVTELDIATSGVSDQIVVIGGAVLGGTLAVSTTPGAPLLGDGDSFALFDFDSSTGVFDDSVLPVLAPGLVWDTSMLGALGVLSVTAGQVGDFNGDGAVDAADYTVWRDTENQAGFGLAADANYDFVVDSEDYLLWVANFGVTQGGGRSEPIPEPSGSLILVAALLCYKRRFSLHQALLQGKIFRVG